MQNKKGTNNPNWKGGHIKKICPSCKKEFETPKAWNSKFCSRECFGKSIKGRRLTEDHKKKISKKLKGITTWNKGLKGWIKHSEETKQKMRANQIGEKNSDWKGDGVGYSGLHEWIRMNKPKPELCEECKKELVYDCHNIDRKYTRDLTKWRYLCRTCHRKYDKKRK